jgi:ornithine cyclodeaminase/alanine dehydrogenase
MRAPVPPLLHLTADEVRAAMPPVAERLDLAERTMTALATPGGADLPPKIGVHPRPEGSFGHAMPAHLRDAREPGRDLLGLKWVTGFPGNRAAGLPAISALVVLNDPATGIPVAILDGGPITADRTAAVSGVAMRQFRQDVGGRPIRIGLVGAGVQGRSHLEVFGHVLPGAHLTVFDRHPERAEALVATARATDGIAGAGDAASAQDCVRDADVVVTAASFTSPERRQAMTRDWLTPEALIVPVDYATYCSADVARGAAAFVVDDRGQFLANRDTGQFDGYPDPAATLGEVILAGASRPDGLVVVTHLGVGLADVVFGAAIVARAQRMGLGRTLER